MNIQREEDWRAQPSLDSWVRKAKQEEEQDTFLLLVCSAMILFALGLIIHL